MLRTSVFDKVDLAAVKARQAKSFTEAVIEKALVRELRKAVRGAEVKKIDATVPGWRTWPDRIAFVPGLPCHFIELKRPKGGKYEPGQEKRHATLRKTYGMAVFVVLDHEDVRRYVDTVKTTLAAKINPETFAILSENTSKACRQLVSSKVHPTSSRSGGTHPTKTG